MMFGRTRCPECGKKFPGTPEMMQHMQLEHAGGGYDCRRCGVVFDSMEAMRTHLQREHGYRR